MAFTWFQSYHRPDSNIHIWRREIQLFSRLQRSPRLGPGPTLLVSYTDDVGLVDLLERHAVQSHMYADDTQFHDSCPPDIDPLHSRLSQTTSTRVSWCKSRRLQLNADKTEAICVGSRSNLAKIANSDRWSKSTRPRFSCLPSSAISVSI